MIDMPFGSYGVITGIYGWENGKRNEVVSPTSYSGTLVYRFDFDTFISLSPIVVSKFNINWQRYIVEPVKAGQRIEILIKQENIHMKIPLLTHVKHVAIVVAVFTLGMLLVFPPIWLVILYHLGLF